MKRLWCGLILCLALSGCGDAADDPGAIGGSWRWFNVPTIYIDANGDLRAPGTAVIGNWVHTGTRQYRLSWYNGAVDALTLSTDANHLDGYNQIGTHVTADRIN